MIYIVVGKLKCIGNISLGRTVEDGCCDIEAECLGCKGQMDLKNLSDVHTGRNAKGIEHDIERSSVGKERHIFNGKNS